MKSLLGFGGCDYGFRLDIDGLLRLAGLNLNSYRSDIHDFSPFTSILKTLPYYTKNDISREIKLLAIRVFSFSIQIAGDHRRARRER